jgi:hypothetical protein
VAEEDEGEGDGMEGGGGKEEEEEGERKKRRPRMVVLATHPRVASRHAVDARWGPWDCSPLLAEPRPR